MFQSVSKFDRLVSGGESKFDCLFPGGNALQQVFFMPHVLKGQYRLNQSRFSTGFQQGMESMS